MKKILILLLFLLTSCGFQPLYKVNNNTEDFKIQKIEFIGNKSLAKKIYLGLPIKIVKNDTSLNKLIINTNKDIIETSKNSNGQVESYRTLITTKLSFINNKNETVREITLNKNFLYGVKENKFKFKEYQIEIENNLIYKIREDLIIFLNS